jgi:anti-anti-sigma factor
MVDTRCAAGNSIGVIPGTASCDRTTSLEPREAPAGCDVEVRRGANSTVVELFGDLETASAPEIERILDGELLARPALLEVSLEGLSFLDSSGLRMFLLLKRNAQRLDVAMRFVRPRGAVRRTLEFAKALDYLGIES